MHSVDAMGEDATVLKKTLTRKTLTRMTRTRKTRRRREFSRILKFNALAIKKLAILPTVFTHSPMHTDARRNSIPGTHAELWQNAFASGARRRTNASTFESAQYRYPLYYFF